MNKNMLNEKYPYLVWYITVMAAFTCKFYMASYLKHVGMLDIIQTYFYKILTYIKYMHTNMTHTNLGHQTS